MRNQTSARPVWIVLTSWMLGVSSVWLCNPAGAQGPTQSLQEAKPAVPPEAYTLQYHLMHPGGESLPGDPNAAFYLDGTYHLHYILQHPWQDRRSFSFVHVTSPDMLHWTWQTTKLQPAMTGHGMFSGTGFLTKEGQPAVIYHGESSGRNQIAIAKDRNLSQWHNPYPVDVRNSDGSPLEMNHWDPDCFEIDGTYYAISGGENPPLLKSTDLKTWTKVGPFLSHDLPDVAKGEDISCANFFPLDGKWVLLCISHDLGCRYYIGDWDKSKEQFVPQHHGRMNSRRENQSLFSRESWRADVFAPESVLTPDGRRVMWAWCATLDRNDGHMSNLTIQTLPRELSLDKNHRMRIHPLRELQALRYEPEQAHGVRIEPTIGSLLANRAPTAGKMLLEFDSDAMEIQLTIDRQQAERKLFGFIVYADQKGGGLPIVFRPETQSLRVGSAEAPFSIADLPPGEDIQLSIFIDRPVVEVFVNGRQAMVGWHPEYQATEGSRKGLFGFSVGHPTELQKVESWKLRPTNQGFLEARENRVWEPKTK